MLTFQKGIYNKIHQKINKGVVQMSEVVTMGEAMADFVATDLDVPLWEANHFYKYLQEQRLT